MTNITEFSMDSMHIGTQAEGLFASLSTETLPCESEPHQE